MALPGIAGGINAEYAAFNKTPNELKDFPVGAGIKLDTIIQKIVDGINRERQSGNDSIIYLYVVGPAYMIEILSRLIGGKNLLIYLISGPGDEKYKINYIIDESFFQIYQPLLGAYNYEDNTHNEDILLGTVMFDNLTADYYDVTKFYILFGKNSLKEFMRIQYILPNMIYYIGEEKFISGLPEKRNFDYFLKEIITNYAGSESADIVLENIEIYEGGYIEIVNVDTIGSFISGLFSGIKNREVFIELFRRD